MYYTKWGGSTLDPQQDDSQRCTECDGDGGKYVTYDGDEEWEECETCRGRGILNYYGNPI